MMTSIYNNHDNDDSFLLRAARRVRQLLRESALLENHAETEDGTSNETNEERLRLRRRQSFAALAFVTALVVCYVRYAKQKRIPSSAAASMATSTGSTTFSLKAWPLVTLLTAWWQGPEYRRSPVLESPLSFLWIAAKEGLVPKARLGPCSIFYQTKSPSGTLQWNRTLLPKRQDPSSPDLQPGLLEALAQGGCTDIQAIPESLASKLATPVLAALPFVYLALLYQLVKSQFGGEDISSKVHHHHNHSLDVEHRTTFADVAGLEQVVADVSEIVSYLANPARYHGVGARPPRGVLLHGPPGSGKTLLARAVAGEARCDTFVACSGSDFVEMYVGRGAARVRALFDKARRDALRRRARWSWAQWLLGWTPLPSSPIMQSSSALQKRRPACAILFIDELDALAKSRSYDGVHGNDEREQTLNQLLTEMDGFTTNQGGGANNNRQKQPEDVTMIVIAASNRADIIDPAVLRRFDRQIFVGYPNAQGRKEILQVHARRIRYDNKNVNWDYLASDAVTGNFSGADLRNLINEAALLAVREQRSLVEQSQLMHAARRINLMKHNLSSQSGRPPSAIFNVD